MHPLAHHAGEDTLAPLLLLGGAWLSVLAAYSRQHLATVRNRLARLGGANRKGWRRRSGPGSLPTDRTIATAASGTATEP